MYILMVKNLINDTWYKLPNIKMNKINIYKEICFHEVYFWKYQRMFVAKLPDYAGGIAETEDRKVYLPTLYCKVYTEHLRKKYTITRVQVPHIGRG